MRAVGWIGARGCCTRPRLSARLGSCASVGPAWVRIKVNTSMMVCSSKELTGPVCVSPPLGKLKMPPSPGWIPCRFSVRLQTRQRICGRQITFVDNQCFQDPRTQVHRFAANSTPDLPLDSLLPHIPRRALADRRTLHRLAQQTQTWNETVNKRVRETFDPRYFL